MDDFDRRLARREKESSLRTSKYIRFYNSLRDHGSNINLQRGKVKCPEREDRQPISAFEYKLKLSHLSFFTWVKSSVRGTSRGF